MTGIYLGFAVLAVLGIVGLIATTIRRRDTKVAFGQMAEEPSKELVSQSAATGKELERSARGGAAGTAVLPHESGPPAVYIPPDAETIGVARRSFLGGAIVAVSGLSLAAFGASIIAFLWPSGAGGGFGSVVNVGRIADIKAGISEGGGFLYVPQGRMWLTEYPASAVVKAESSYTFYSDVEQGLQQGVVALYQTCPHLGCRVPECATSQWFECPCHGSQYNRVGEKKGGPAPRGMDRFPMKVTAAKELEVDTGTVIQGPPIGTNTTGQEAEGPNCLGAGGGH